MAPRSKGARLKLEEPLASDFLDFRAANYWASEIEVIRVALREHIDRRLANEPELRRLVGKVRERRLGDKEKLKVLRAGKDGNS